MDTKLVSVKSFDDDCNMAVYYCSVDATVADVKNDIKRIFQFQCGMLVDEYHGALINKKQLIKSTSGHIEFFGLNHNIQNETILKGRRSNQNRDGQNRNIFGWKSATPKKTSTKQSASENQQETKQEDNYPRRKVGKVSKTTGFVDQLRTKEILFLFSVLCASLFLLCVLDLLFVRSGFTHHFACTSRQQSTPANVVSLSSIVSSRFVSAVSAVLDCFEQAKKSVCKLDGKQWGSALLLSVLLSFAVDFDTEVIDRLVARAVTTAKVPDSAPSYKLQTLTLE